MNKFTRAIGITAMALAAGATMGAGPAFAAQPATAAAPQGARGADHWPSHDQVAGYFRNAFACHRAGRLGEIRNRWEDHTCSPVHGGFHRGWWVLTVDSGHHGHHGHDWNGGQDWNGGHDGHGGQDWNGGHDGNGGHDWNGGHDGNGGHDMNGGHDWHHDGPGPWL